MKCFVLMNRKTADLMIGYRVSLFDKPDLGWSSDITPSPDRRFSIGILEHDGWVVGAPKAVPFLIFFNRKCEGFFEVLGEL